MSPMSNAAPQEFGFIYLQNSFLRFKRIVLTINFKTIEDTIYIFK